MQRPASKKDGKRLWAAAKDGDVETIGSMLNTIDMNVNEYQDENGWTALDIASSYGYVPAMELLVNHQADVNSKDKSGWTALHLASWNGNVPAMELLVNHQADVNAKTKAGSTPLHIASFKGHVPAMELLVNHQADVNAKADNGETPLMKACCYGDVQIDAVKHLVSRGCNINMKAYENGKTALTIARERSKQDIVNYLLEIIEMSRNYVEM